MLLTIKILSITLLSFFLVKLVLKLAHKLDLYDVPNERSHHCSVTPSGAGIGFMGTFFIAIALFESQFLVEFWYMFFSIFIVFTVGIYDDRHEVSAKLKFIAIFFSTAILWFNGFSVNTLGHWYGYDVVLSPVIALFFSMFALAGFTNALNLIDGIDGLSTSVSLVILLFFSFIGFEYHNDLLVILSTFTMAALVGFLFINWHPAKIFMGDSGSLAIGFIISVLAVLSLEYIHPIAIFYLTAMPILDTLIVMIRRIRRGKSPFSPDKTHIHHIMVKFFDMNVPKTVSFLVILQIIFSSIGYMILSGINKGLSEHIPLFATMGFVFMFVLFYMIFTGIKKRQIRLDSESSSE